MVVALSHLGDPAAIEPLLRLLEDRATDRRIRESAATTLGILLDPRERDPLFEIDAYASPYGLTYATRELVRIY
jgi:HEAT repeat protein